MRRLTAWALTATLVLPNVSYARADEADLFADSVKLESVEKEAAAQTSEKIRLTWSMRQGSQIRNSNITKPRIPTQLPNLPKRRIPMPQTAMTDSRTRLLTAMQTRLKLTGIPFMRPTRRRAASRWFWEMRFR